MTSRNDITGDKIQTTPTTKEYADNYDKIFGITISQREYNQLKKDSDWLYYLERAGVANWDGFDYALKLKEQDEDFGTN